MTLHKRICLLAAVAMLSAPVAHGQDASYPNDPAKLYESAKKEGALTWYVSGPLEAMRAIAESKWKIRLSAARPVDSLKP